MTLRKRLVLDWEAQWREEKVGSITRKLIEVPARATLRLHIGLRALSSVLVQLRTGKISVPLTKLILHLVLGSHAPLSAMHP